MLENFRIWRPVPCFMPVVFLALLLLGSSAARAAPAYSAAGIVNAGDNQPGFLAPNAIGTIYGTGLAYGTKVLTPDDIRGGVLPNVMPGTGVRVLIGGGLPHGVYSSPPQNNVLQVPSMVA